jgi:hypothetical protein
MTWGEASAEQAEKDQPSQPVLDDLGHEMGYCNSCGEEAELDSECCEDGEVVEYGS